MVLVELESSVQKVKELNDQGKLNLYTKYQIDSVSWR